MFLKAFIQCFFINLAYSVSKHPVLVVVSYDAFRYNFIDPKTVPQMYRLRQVGTYADYLINVFPTKTFPNHHSIATGLYPEVHGVVGNSYFDVPKNKMVNIGYEMFHYDEAIVPIWRKNEDLGDERYTGVMMWPGASYPYQGKNVTYMRDFDPTYDWYKRIDTVIEWIKNPKRPANLVMIYFEEPDTHAHAFGTNSNVVQGLIKRLDNITHYLERQLEFNDLVDKTNIVHLSDHGMINVRPPNFINITQYLEPKAYTIAGASPILQIMPKKGYEDKAYQSLKNASIRNGHFQVYKKSEYLTRWHYKDNPRTPPIIVMADVGYALDDLITAAPMYAKKYNFNLTSQSEFGVHGYDYNVMEMHPFFMARGPKIKSNHKVKPFNTVDLFNLFCKILEIPLTKNNGTVDNIEDILVQNNGRYSLSSLLIITAGGILIAVILISCAAIITLIMIKRQQSITTTAALNKRFPQTFQTSIEAQHLLEPEEA